MAHTKDANFNQYHIFPPVLEDMIAADHPARFIRELVDVLDLKELGISVRHSDRGGYNYAEKLYCRVWLYGWMRRIRSSRGLEQGTYDNLGIMWLAGMHHPDHNSLWRFFRDNKKQLKKLFKAVLKISIDAGLVGFVLQAVDGTKIKANADRDKLIELKKVKTILTHLDTLADQVVAETEQQEKQSTQRTTLPASLKDREELQKVVQQGVHELKKKSPELLVSEEEHQGLQELNNEMKSKRSSYVSVTDKDARMMKCGPSKTFGYNAQIVADEKHGLIVAADVTDENYDYNQLNHMLDQVKENTGRVADETAADGGYSSAHQIEQAEENKYPIIVPDGKGGKVTKFHVSKFQYDAERNGYICPLGTFLPYECKARSKGRTCHRYRCHNRECPHRSKCSRSKSGRTIYRSTQAEVMDRHRQKINKQRSKELYKRRKVIAEPPFHVIKNILGFRQWTVREKENVQAQWYLICTAYNLKKLYVLWRSGLLKLNAQAMG